jgi:hypothetical protein
MVPASIRELSCQLRFARDTFTTLARTGWFFRNKAISPIRQYPLSFSVGGFTYAFKSLIGSCEAAGPSGIVCAALECRRYLQGPQTLHHALRAEGVPKCCPIRSKWFVIIIPTSQLAVIPNLRPGGFSD